MIDELELLKTIIQELTGAGIWAMVAYISYSLLKVVFTLWVILWASLKVIDRLFNYFKDTRLPRHLSDQLLDDLKKREREIADVKHAYQIMKEKMEADSDPE